MAAIISPVEPQITVNPRNPANLILTEQSGLEVSTDAGATFGVSSGGVFTVGSALSFPAPAGTTGPTGDTRTVFDSNGNLFWENLARVSGVLSIYITQVNPTLGTQIGTTTRVTTPPLENPMTMNRFQDYDDKPSLAADNNGNLFLAWSRATLGVSAGSTFIQWQIRLSKGTNTGTAQSPNISWTSEANQAVVSAASDGDFLWPTSLTVSSNGDVFVAYHADPNSTANGGNNTLEGGVFVVRYDNNLNLVTNGKTSPFPVGSLVNGVFTAGSAVISSSYPTLTWPVGPNSGLGTAPVGGPVILADPTRPGILYLFTVNDPSNGSATGDPADLLFARSIDSGQHWTTSTLESGPNSTNSLEILPTAAIDKFGDIVVAWYDGRNGGTSATSFPSGFANGLLDIYAKYSTDGGVTWSSSFRVDGPGNRFDPGTARPMDYFGIALFGDTAYVAWVGNTFTKGVADANSQQVWTTTFGLSGSIRVTDDNDLNNGITIDHVAGNLANIEITVNGKIEYAGLADGITSITVNASTASSAIDVVDVEHNLFTSITVNLGSGTGTVDIDGNLQRYEIISDVTVHGTDGADDTLNVYDQKDTHSTNWTVTGSSITPTNLFLASSVKFDHLSSINSSVNLYGGPSSIYTVKGTSGGASHGATIYGRGGVNTFAVQATNDPLTLFSHGANDAVNVVESVTTLSNLAGLVTIIGNGHTSLTLDDSPVQTVSIPVILPDGTNGTVTYQPGPASYSLSPSAPHPFAPGVLDLTRTSKTLVTANVPGLPPVNLVQSQATFEFNNFVSVTMMDGKEVDDVHDGSLPIHTFAVTSTAGIATSTTLDISSAGAQINVGDANNSLDQIGTLILDASASTGGVTAKLDDEAVDRQFYSEGITYTYQSVPSYTITNQTVQRVNQGTYVLSFSNGAPPTARYPLAPLP